ncbi:FecR family protein [Spirosoma sp. KUDC1026]|uniref:FecR family protein n=1 Tax=Spirosoma sp. KUDC1026 TaxID=2745947 RepID=UPI00159BDBAE|nr:FecR domain-containing protein [Spirosoma sp. KUDC1026]QKZ13618.1 FecR domain-containing protein [Spirosoma sp. KUDC1026]
MQTITKALLLEHHAGRTTPLQVRLIEDWLKDPQHQVIYYQTLFEWESTYPQYVADTDSALERFRQVMNEPISAPLPATPSPVRTGWRLLSPWLVAASLTLLIGLIGWLFREPILYQTYVTHFGQLKTVQLSDGSQVVLNSNSSLRVPRTVLGQALTLVQDRIVTLTGEATFRVTHTHDNRRFVVRTGRELDVEVLGTEFVVFNRARATRVALLTGSVKLRSLAPSTAQREWLMRPGELATWQPNGTVQVSSVARPVDEVAWTEHRFVFNNTPLREVGYMIQENYGLNVAIKDARLAERMVTGTFDADSADELLRVLRELLGINVTRQRNRIYFSEK